MQIIFQNYFLFEEDTLLNVKSEGCDVLLFDYRKALGESQSY